MQSISFSSAAKNAVAHAAALARQYRHAYVGTEHLLLSLLQTETQNHLPCVAAKLLTAHGIDAEKTIQLLHHGSEGIDIEPQATPAFDRICQRAGEEAARFLIVSGEDCPQIGTEHLLFALLCENDSAASHILSAQNVPLHELYGDVLSFLSSVSAEQAIFSENKADTPQSAHTSEEKNSKSVESFLFDMTKADFDPVIGREKETEQVIRILLRRQKNNPCLLGEAGVGKTAVIEGLAQRIAAGEVPEALRGHRILSLDLAALIAGTKYRGEFEERLRAVLSLCAEDPRIILFLDEMHILMGAGAAEGAIDAANLLKPALSRGRIRLIGATTHGEFRQTIARDAAMMRRFQTVSIEEPDTDTALRILSAQRDILEKHHHVRIPDETLHAAIQSSVRYLPEFFLPDKALDCIDDAAAAVRLKSAGGTPSSPQAARDNALLTGNLPAAQTAAAENPASPLDVSAGSVLVVTPSDIDSVITARTGIPIPTDTEETERLLHLEDILRASILGQEDAVIRVSAAIRRLRTGLRDPNRPAASFLFWGTTGVGKTALCRVLAKTLFGSETDLIRFDMSEYMEKHAAAKLIGAPPGYVGYETGGILTERVHHHPYSLLLFDEIEKAHPDVMHIFLQLLDDGHLTDGHGRRVDFRNTIVVMTTNAGQSQKTAQPLGFAIAKESTDVRPYAALADAFAPEFLNRFDEIVPFRSLTHYDIRKILMLFLSETKQRLSVHNITLKLSEPALSHLVSSGFDPQMGARPLRRAIAKEIETPIAEGLLSGKYQPGDIIMVRRDGNSLAFSRFEQ